MRAVNGFWDQALESLSVEDSEVVVGTTWKKKSRQGSPEERKVGDWLVVKPLGRRLGRVEELKSATMKSMKESPVPEFGDDDEGFVV